MDFLLQNKLQRLLCDFYPLLQTKFQLCRLSYRKTPDQVVKILFAKKHLVPNQVVMFQTKLSKNITCLSPILSATDHTKIRLFRSDFSNSICNRRLFFHREKIKISNSICDKIATGRIFCPFYLSFRFVMVYKTDDILCALNEI